MRPLQASLIETTSALLQILKILSWRKQKERKPRNHDFEAGVAWIINSGKIKSRRRALPCFTCLRAEVIFLAEKFLEIFTGMVLWPSKSQTLFEKQVEMTWGQQSRIFRF